MKKMRLLLICASILTVTGSFFSCENEKDASLYLRADSLNQVAYKVRYKEQCEECDAQDCCGGFFSSTINIKDITIKPIKS